MRVWIIPLLSLFALNGCSNNIQDFTPGWMPTLYKYQHEEYKAPPPRDVPDVGYEYSKGMNDDVMIVWQAIADNLVTGLEQNANLTPRPVYIESLPDHNAFNASYEFALRDVFRQKGYTLVNEPARAVHVRYEAYRDQDANLRNEIDFNNEEDNFLDPFYKRHPHDFTFVLTAGSDDQLLGQSYFKTQVPAYGYVADEGQHPIEQRVRKDAPPKRVKSQPLYNQ